MPPLRYRLFVALVVGGMACAEVAPPADERPWRVQIAGHDLYVPPGFTVNVFASGATFRNLVLGPDGAVYASVWEGNRLLKLPDVNGDGVADTVITVRSGLTLAHGIAFRGDTLYYSQSDRVARLDPGSANPVTIVSAIPAGHWPRTILFGSDGKLYVHVGSSCNICDEANPRSASVLQFNPDGSGERSFATGLRNSIGLAFHPTTGDLWATNNDRDNLGGANTALTDDSPPERINILHDGMWYGWPQCYLPGLPNPEYAGADCSGVEPPAITMQAHSAPLGMAFYTGTAFPAAYRGDAFVAYHGSWNRTVPTGAKVVRVRVENGRPTAIEDFVTGWQLGNGTRWGRPVWVLSHADGSLLISDDLGAKIYRVSYIRGST